MCRYPNSDTHWEEACHLQRASVDNVHFDDRDRRIRSDTSSDDELEEWSDCSQGKGDRNRERELKT